MMCSVMLAIRNICATIFCISASQNNSFFGSSFIWYFCHFEWKCIILKKRRKKWRRRKWGYIVKKGKKQFLNEKKFRTRDAIHLVRNRTRVE